VTQSRIVFHKSMAFQHEANVFIHSSAISRT
jgi:hypothetical protein